MDDSCATSDLLTLEQALSQILSELPAIDAYERVPLKHALNRITYKAVHAAINVPNFRNSSMDGYALRSIDKHSKVLNIIGTSWAGKPFTKPIADNECIRIFTGAYVPDQCDCVVMQENVHRIDETIHLTQWPVEGENIRQVGDDTQKGQLLFAKGRRLQPADIGLLASCGIADVAVFKKLNVGFFSTGDELAPIGSQPEPGQIFDSNRYTLHALLETANITPTDLGVIPDDPIAIESALIAASNACDVIITTGGASVGEADFIVDILEKIGRVNLWKIAIKPGKPLVFGSINKTAFFGLPGNPVSVMVTFQQIVQPALQTRAGLQQNQTPITLQAKTAEGIKKQPGRTEFQRGFVENINGELVVHSTGNQGSHIISSMSKANCLIVLEQYAANIEKGQHVNIQLLTQSL